MLLILFFTSTSDIYRALCSRYNHDSTSTRRPFDGCSTACQRSSRSQWRNTSPAADPLVAVTLTYLFI